MTYQTNLASSGFRELNPAELEVVSGGITVTAPRPTGTTSSGAYGGAHGDGAGGIGSGLSSFQMMDLSLLGNLATALSAINGADERDSGDEILGANLVDNDGDGKFDEIIVERTSTGTVDSEYYAWLNPETGVYSIFRDTANSFEELLGLDEDQFIGDFVLGSSEDHDLVLTEGSVSHESNNGVNVSVAGNGGGLENGHSFERSSGNTQYFRGVEP